MGNTQNTPAQSIETTANDQAVNPYEKYKTQQESATAVLDESKPGSHVYC